MQAEPDQTGARKRWPSVVIAGRPNVGKSALFNRLAGRRVAIVHGEEGVTRDRVSVRADWDGLPLELTDTGGLGEFDGAAPRGRIEGASRRQAEAALDAADAVILVTDVEQGPTPLDEEAARRMRRQGKRVFVACNKCDTEARDGAAALFERFGFPVFPVSALHNRGCDELRDAVRAVLPSVQAVDEALPLKVAVVGRPNVGKSSLINAWLGSDRVIVSEVAGTTRDSVDIPFAIGTRQYLLTDTAGIRRVGKTDTAVEKFSLIRAEESIRASHLAVVVLDAIQGPTLQEKKVASLVREHRRGCVLAVNKWDLVRGRVTEKEYLKGVRAAAPFLSYAPLLFVSARTGYNLNALAAAVDRVAGQVQATLTTGALNRVLREAQDRTPAPAPGGRRLKVFYATQVGMDPVRVALFVNDPARMTPAYQSYLEKALRAHFGLEGAPVEWSLKARRAGDGDAAD